LKLRELGVVHVVQKQKGALSDEGHLSEWLNLEKRYNQIVIKLNHFNIERVVKTLAPTDKTVSGDELLEKAEKLFDIKDKLTLEKQGIQKEMERIAPLGDFDLSLIHRLEEKGWYMHFFVVSKSKFDTQWVDTYNAVKLSHNKSQIYFATFTQNHAHPHIEAEVIRLSEKSFLEWESDLKILVNRYREIEDELAKMAQEQIETLRYNEKIVKDNINFEKVELSGHAAAGEKLMILEGYIPAEEEPQATEILHKEAIYFNVSEPTPQDNPPIKLKNNRFFRAFEMIADLYDKPHYNAFDFTPFFAPFYIIFFGLCLGDAGYGLIFLVASFYLRRSKDDFLRTAAQLALYFGIGTIIFGFVSGTFFGIQLLKVDWAWLQPFKAKGLIMTDKQLFYFALIMGGLQIIYAIIIKGITRWMRFGFLYSLDAFGWLLTILGAGSVFLLGDMGKITPELQSTLYTIVISAGGFMMLFFNNPQKGLKGIPGSIGAGLFGFYNKLSGLMGDLLSYIRLFALGISGAVMGLVFNDLAMGLAPDIIIARELVMIIILLFGHGINIFINSLGAFIHPVRLTFVEFYNNVGFEGGGKPYTPFIKQAE
jgi:V/A-type H+-transporting ATPase subunit I